MAYQPNQNPTWAERDSLDPNDSRRIIKGADFGAEFDSIKTELDSISSGIGNIEHGNVASCYWNPTFVPKLAYAHNVSEVILDPDDPSNMQTRIVFIDKLDGIPGNDDVLAAHFSFNITPVSGTGYPTLVTVVGAANTHISFLSWHLVSNVWTPIPGTELGFSFMVNDMDKAQ